MGREKAAAGSTAERVEDARLRCMDWIDDEMVDRSAVYREMLYATLIETLQIEREANAADLRREEQRINANAMTNTPMKRK